MTINQKTNARKAARKLNAEIRRTHRARNITRPHLAGHELDPARAARRTGGMICI